MPYTVVNLPSLTTPTTSSTFAGMSTAAGSLQSTVTTLGIGLLDDASSITVYMASTGTFLSSTIGSAIIQVSQFDPAQPLPIGVTQSTAWYNYSLTATNAGLPLLSSGTAFTISNVSFRGLRISTSQTSGNTANEVVAFVSKQISV